MIGDSFLRRIGGGVLVCGVAGLVVANTVAPLAGEGVAFDLDHALQGGAETLRVEQGDQVEVRWTSDRAATLHLHGYDLELEVTPAAPARVRFEAHATGRFPVTLHGAEGGSHGGHGGGEPVVLYIEVHPR